MSERCEFCNAVDEDIIEDRMKLREYPIMLKYLQPLLAWDLYRGPRKMITLMAVKNILKENAQIKLYCWIKDKNGEWKNTTSGIVLSDKINIDKIGCMYKIFQERVKKMSDDTNVLVDGN